MMAACDCRVRTRVASHCPGGVAGLTARDGDVIIGHINQPKRSSGAGLTAGILALKTKGFTFVRLDDVPEIGAWGEA